MERIPLSEASLSEVLARVAYECIRYHYLHYDYHTTDGPTILAGIARELDECGFRVLAVWVSAYRYQVTPLTPTKFVRDAFIFRAKQGYSWRSVVFPQYKRSRCDPRVTNRGVARETYLKEIKQ